MKQVVIKGNYNTNNLLTPYLTKEFLKLKGYEEVYAYECREIGGLDRLIQIKDTKLKEYGFYTYNPIYYATEDINVVIEYGDFTRDYREKIIPINKLLGNREDKELIEIVKKINDESNIKIIEIPDDVQYGISIGKFNIEFIKENSREWK